MTFLIFEKHSWYRLLAKLRGIEDKHLDSLGPVPMRPEWLREEA